jgi:glycosyltransferase involved in cell wall biosynthesis
VTTPIEVSVIVPTYNRANRLARCLDSIPWRIHDNLEIVVVDDGSTDDTSRVLNAFIDLGAPLRLVKLNINRGVGAARVAGLSNSAGAVVMWLDSDDEWLPGAFETMLNELNATDRGAVVQGQLFHRMEHGLAWPDWVTEPMRDVPTFSSHFGAMAMVRDIFEKHPIKDSLRLVEDFEWELRVQRSGIQIRRFLKPVLVRWIGADNLCHDRVQADEYLQPVLLGHARELAKAKRTRDG